MKISVLSYGCSSAAGQGVNPFWSGLAQGIDHSRPIDTSSWKVSPSRALSACKWNQQGSAHQTLMTQLIFSWEELLERLSSAQKNNLGNNLGIIFASTKGLLEDFVWLGNPELLPTDPLTPVLDAFIQETGLTPHKKICVSLACASSHGAFYLATHWLKTQAIDHVLILAADTIGPFVVNGFYSLRALAAGKNRPFSGERDGLQLGDAAAAILISKEEGPFVLDAVALDTEGHAITKSSQDGASLKKIHQLLGLREKKIDAIVVHGTGTRENDRVEDLVLSSTFTTDRPPTMGTKWSIGHTLGASGAMDFIAACEMMRHQRPFRLANTQAVDPTFKHAYLTAGSPLPAGAIKTVLVHSLGFGGIHGGLITSKN
jgi:3-oxoacyl-[acyl-carrier-protein] synthase-1